MTAASYKVLVQIVREKCVLGDAPGYVFTNGIPKDVFLWDVARPGERKHLELETDCGKYSEDEFEAMKRKAVAEIEAELKDKKLTIVDTPRAGEMEFARAYGLDSEQVYVVASDYQHIVWAVLKIQYDYQEPKRTYRAIKDFWQTGVLRYPDITEVEYLRGTDAFAELVLSPEIVQEVENEGTMIPFLTRIFEWYALERDDWSQRLRRLFKNCENVRGHNALLHIYCDAYKRMYFAKQNRDRELARFVAPSYDWCAGGKIVEEMFRYMRGAWGLLPEAGRERLAQYRRELGKAPGQFVDGDGHDLLWQILWSAECPLLEISRRDAEPQRFEERVKLLEEFGCDPNRKDIWGFSWKEFIDTYIYREEWKEVL